MFADDQLILDENETVTVTSVRTAGNVTATIDSAVRYGIGGREMAASAGRYTAGDVVWTVRTSDLPFTPKLADYITDASNNRWTVIDDMASTGAGFLKFTTRNLVIAADLKHTITIQRPVTQDTTPTGDRKPNFAPVVSNAVCRVQEVSRSINDDYLGKRVTEVRYTVYCQDQIPELTHEDRIVWQGRTLEFAGGQDADRIDVLSRFDAIWRF